jgi:hypothetical protein
MNLPILTESPLPIDKKDVDDFYPQTVKQHDFAIMFDNFLRDKITFELIKSIQTHYPTVKMYIGEQGVFNPIKDRLYKKLENAGHEIVYCGFDAGLSVCRNKMVEAIKEPYIFYCDSDNLFIEQTKIEMLQRILNNDETIGLVSCYETNQTRINHYEKNLKIDNKNICYLEIPSEERDSNLNYFYCDMTQNVGLVRKDVFKTIKWDNRMKLAEHLDFFLLLKYKSSWKVACSTNVFINNQMYAFKNEKYNAYRNRNKEYWILYESKWKVDSINNWFILKECKSTPSNETVYVAPIVINKGVVEEQELSLEQAIFNFWDEIEPYQRCSFLTKLSCLDVVKNKTFITKKLSISTKTEAIKKEIISIYNNKNRLFTLDINVEPVRPLKSVKIKHMNFNVPYPVVHYLTVTFQKSFKELIA